MNRWIRLSAAILAMIMVGNLQYAWTLFVPPIVSSTGWKLSDVQWGFTFFVALETWAMPLAGWFIDRYGPRVFIIMSGVLCGAGWSLMGQAHTLPHLYLLYSTVGLGVAFVYCGSIGVALKWFPDKRGLASGLIAAGYGSGATIFNPLFAYILHATDYRTTFLWTGIVEGLAILAAGLMLRNPPKGAVPVAVPAKAKVRSHSEDFTPWEMLRTPQFYILYLMMLMVSIGGLMATAQVAPVARNFKVGAAVLAVALSLDAAFNGTGRIWWGWVSDHIGRERTMLAGFALQAVFLCAVVTVGRTGAVWFVLSMALVYFTWGEIYVLFPAVLADRFGARYSAANYSFLYSTKGVSSILAGGLAAKLFERTGSWNDAFFGSAALALASALAAVVLLKLPLPKKRVPAAATVPTANLLRERGGAE